jgi:hypothetical protein
MIYKYCILSILLILKMITLKDARNFVLVVIVFLLYKIYDYEGFKSKITTVVIFLMRIQGNEQTMGLLFTIIVKRA